MSKERTSGDGGAKQQRAMAFWRAFWQGASTPSLGVLAAIVTLAGAQFVAILLWLTPQRIADEGPGLWMNDPWDHSAYVTAEALRMERSDPETLGIAVLGSSSMRHVFEDHEAFRVRLAERFESPVQMHFLAAGGQSLWESELLLDHLPDGFRGAVVIGVHPGRAIYDPGALGEWLEQPRLGLEAESTRRLRDRFGLPQPEQTGFYFLDHMPFLAARRVAIARNLLTGPQAYAKHGRRIDAPLSAEAVAMRDAGAPSLMKHWEEDGAAGARALQRLVERLSAAGIEVIVAFSPLHPNVEAHHPEAVARFRALMRESAVRAGASVLDFNTEAALAEDDFRDVFHLDTSGARARCEDALALELTDRLRPPDRDHKEMPTS